MSEHEDGFTLIELLVTVVILGIIISAISTSMIVGLRTTDALSARLNESHDAQNAVAYFNPDVQSADDVATVDATCTGGTLVVRLRWVDTDTYLSCYYTTNAGGELRLMRKLLKNGVAQTTIAISHFLSDTAPSVACSPSCSGRPTKVTLTVNACIRNASLNCDASTNFTYALSAYLRDTA